MLNLRLIDDLYREKTIAKMGLLHRNLIKSQGASLLKVQQANLP